MCPALERAPQPKPGNDAADDQQEFHFLTLLLLAVREHNKVTCAEAHRVLLVLDHILIVSARHQRVQQLHG